MNRIGKIVQIALAATQRILVVFALGVVAFSFWSLEGCALYGGIRVPDLAGRSGSAVRMEATGYDSGQKSCNWKYDRNGNPVIASGPNKGKPKAVGVTASGTKARKGTIAADTDYYPFGTIMYIPGYGYGKVEDRGGAIKGPHRIDLWFPTEKEALNWGRQKNLTVKVWKP